MKNKIIRTIVVMLLITFSVTVISCTNNKDIKKEIKISIEDPGNKLLIQNNLIGKTYVSKYFKITIVEPNSKIDYKIVIENSGNSIDPKMEIIDPNVPKSSENDIIVRQIPDNVSKDISDFIKMVNKNSKK